MRPRRQPRRSLPSKSSLTTQSCCREQQRQLPFPRETSIPIERSERHHSLCAARVVEALTRRNEKSVTRDERYVATAAGLAYCPKLRSPETQRARRWHDGPRSQREAELETSCFYSPQGKVVAADTTTLLSLEKMSPGVPSDSLRSLPSMYFTAKLNLPAV
jgi:hypothetical protein